MSRPGLSIKVDGLKQIEKAFDALPKKLKAAQKRATRLSMTILTKATRAKAPNVRKRVTVTHNGQQVKLLVYGNTGSLKKAIGNKVGVMRKNGSVYGLVGPRRKKDCPPIIAWNPITKKRVKIIPTQYAHLVEFGFKQKVRWGKRLKNAVDIRPKPFMRPAMDASKGQIESKVRQTLAEELAKSTIAQMGNQT